MTDTSKEAVDETIDYIMADMHDGDEVIDLLRALLAERDAYRAVLSGAGYSDIDGIGKNTIEQSRVLGVEVAKRIIAVIAERNELRKDRAIVTY